MFTQRKTIRRWIQVVVLGLLLPVTIVQAAYQCVTPPVTEAYLRSMDDRIEVLEQVLEDTGCTNAARVTLFGLDFYPDPDQEGDNLTGNVYQTGRDYLAQSMAVSFNESLGLKEFFLSFTGTQNSYQLYLDVQQAQKRLERMRELLGMTKQGCAADASVDGVRLDQYAETWYYAYRQLYFWLLVSDQPNIALEYQEVPTTLFGGTTILNTVAATYTTLAQERLKPEAQGAFYAEPFSCSFAPTGAATRERAGEAALPQNFFQCNVFYTSAYAGAAYDTCQSPELNLQGLENASDGLDASLQAVGESFDQIGEEVNNLGTSIGGRLEDVEDFWQTGDISGFVRTRSNLEQAGNALRANFQEFLTPAENASQAEVFLQKTSSPLAPGGKSLEVTCIQEQSVTGTIGDLLNQAFGCEQNLKDARAEVEKELQQQLSNTLSIRGTYLQEYTTLRQAFTKSLDLSKESANNMSTVCLKHRPREGQECGQQ